jgi:hypothetical protein
VPSSAANPALARLEALIGDWDGEALIDGQLVGRSHTSFTRASAGGFVLQHTTALPAAEEVPPEWEANLPFPIHAVIGADDFGDEFTILYSDARGICRVYRMTLADGEWRLWGRAKADFFQRYAGTISADGRVITGRWERSTDGQAWELDFELVYTQVA